MLFPQALALGLVLATAVEAGLVANEGGAPTFVALISYGALTAVNWWILRGERARLFLDAYRDSRCTRAKIALSMLLVASVAAFTFFSLQ